MTSHLRWWQVGMAASFCQFRVWWQVGWHGVLALVSYRWVAKFGHQFVSCSLSNDECCHRCRIWRKWIGILGECVLWWVVVCGDHAVLEVQSVLFHYLIWVAMTVGFLWCHSVLKEWHLVYLFWCVCPDFWRKHECTKGWQHLLYVDGRPPKEKVFTKKNLWPQWYGVKMCYNNTIEPIASTLWSPYGCLWMYDVAKCHRR